MNHYIKCLFTVLFLFLLVVVSPAAADYSTYQADNARSGTVDEALTIGIPLNSEELPDWSFVDYEHGNTLLLGSKYSNSADYMINSWNEEDFGIIDSTPVIEKGKAYYVTTPTDPEGVTNENIGVYCIDMSTHERLWYTPLEGGGVSGLTIKDDKLYLGSVSGKLYCLNISGEIIWESDKIDNSDKGLSSTPLVLGDAVYVTSQSPAALWSFSCNDGKLLYNNTLEDSSSRVAEFSSPSTDGRSIYTTGAFGVSAFNPESQTNIWDFPLDNAAGTPVYSDNTIFFETKTAIYAVNSSTGEKNWETAHSGFATSPAVKDNIVIVNGQKGLNAYNAQNGDLLWEHTPSEDSLNFAVDRYYMSKAYDVLNISVSPNSPVIAGDMAYYTANARTSIELDDDGDGINEHCNEIFSLVYGVNLTNGVEPSVAVNSLDLIDFDPTTMEPILLGEVTIHPFSGAIPGTCVNYASPVISNNLIILGLAGALGLDDAYNGWWTWFGGLYGLGKGGAFTEYLYSDTVKIPPSLTVEIQGSIVPYTTPLGLLSAAAETTGKSFAFSENMLTAYGEIENDDTNQWYMQINGVPALDITTEIQDGDRVAFYYGGTKYTGEALYALKLTADILDSFATVTIKPDYKRAFQPSETDSQELSTVITDWKGNTLTPQNNEITWTSSSSAFTLNPNGLSLIYTPAGNVGDSAVFTITYTPTNGAGASISAATEPLSIYERTSPIISNDTIETTINYFTWKGNYARTGVANGTGPVTDDILWDVEMPVIDKSYVSLVDGSPVVHDGKVYVSVWGGGMAKDNLKTGVFCFDAYTGEEIWNSHTWQSRAGMTIYNDKLYVSGGQCLVCLDTTDGHLLWRTQDISIYPYVGLTATPIVYNGVAYITTTTLSGNEIINNLYGFDAETGTQVFKMSGQAPDGYSGGAGMFASPSMSPDGVLYVPGAGGVYAVDTSTNAKLWEFDAGARSTAKQGQTAILGGNGIYVGSPIYKDQCVYFVRGGNQTGEPRLFYCLDAITGKEMRKYEVESSAITPVIDGDKLITLGAILSDPASTGGATAYNLTTGEMLWHYESGGSSRASPIVAGDAVYFGTYSEGTLYAVNTTTGDEIWHYKMPKAQWKSDGWWNIIEGTPAIENGILYIGAENGHFYAFKTPSLEDIEITAPQNITAGVPAVLSGKSPIDGTYYSWTFGDESKAAGQTVSKTWNTAGTYTVKLKAVVNGQSGTAQKTITVEAPPKQITQPEPAEIIGITIPEEQKPLLVFDETDKNESAAEITITISDYQTDASGAVSLGTITAPPETQKSVLKIVLTADGLKNEHKLGSYAKLTVNMTITEADKNNLSFWRYPDALSSDALPSRLTHTVNTTGDGWTTFDINIPGFSTILGTIGTGQIASAVENENTNIYYPTPIQTPSVPYVSINPGTGTFKYTTNHPDWPAVTFNIDHMTAFGVLEASGHRLVTAERWGGLYVHSIDGKAPSSDSEGWMYQVNGRAPGAMSNNCPVNFGDTVVWYYSENMNAPISASPAVYYFKVSNDPTVKPTQQALNLSNLTTLPAAEKVTEEVRTVSEKTGLVKPQNSEHLTEISLPLELIKQNEISSLEIIEGNKNEIKLPDGFNAAEVNFAFELTPKNSVGMNVELTGTGYITFKCSISDNQKIIVGHLNKQTEKWENCEVTNAGTNLWKAEYSSMSPFLVFVTDKNKENPLTSNETKPEEMPTAPPVETTAPAYTQTSTSPTAAAPSQTQTPQSPAALAAILSGLAAAAIIAQRRN